MALSHDAVVFGMAYLNGGSSKLSFGGDGAIMEITPRARAALNELLDNGFAIETDPIDQIKGREYYCGAGWLGKVAREIGFDPFSQENDWPTFVKKGDE